MNASSKRSPIVLVIVILAALLAGFWIYQEQNEADIEVDLPDVEINQG